MKWQGLFKIEPNIKEMYESNLVGTISWQKVKLYQATYEEFLDATRYCHDLDNYYGYIHVDYNSPAVAQLWGIIKPIINMNSGKMKEFLGIFGVKENSISPFCRTFVNANELRDAFMLYFPPIIQQQKQDKPINDLEEQISDVDVDNEMPNIETVKSIIEKVEKNMASAINDDEIVEPDHYTGDLDYTERCFTSLKFHNAVDGSVSLEKFRGCFSCNNIEDISQLTNDGIYSLELK